MFEHEEDAKPKKERSPSYPFISLRKAIDRAESLYNGHRREPTRLPALAQTWGYSPSSSGLQQTVAALKQYGLLEEEGSGTDRKVRISELARRILADLRPGAREDAIKEAATRPRLFAEYLPKWFPSRPSDAHCISELHFDRGFNQSAAQLFLRVFDETVAFADLSSDDTEGESDDASVPVSTPEETAGRDDRISYDLKSMALPAPPKDAATLPLSERLQVSTTGNRLTVSAALFSAKEVDKLIRILRANRELLEELDEDDEAVDDLA